LLSIAIYAGVAIAISAAIGFVYPEHQHTAFALRAKGWEEEQQDLQPSSDHYDS
jgi:hypothetical protein